MKSSASSQNDVPQMAFIVGMHRSGTTLLTNMLNSHPKLIATPENEFILFTYYDFCQKNFSDPEVVNSFLSVFDHPFNKEMSIWRPGPGIREDIATLTERNFSNVCKAVYLNYPFAHNKKDIKWIIDKNPSYSLYISKLHHAFPNAKFIILTRDFRDNVLSRIKYTQGQRSVFNLGITLNFYYEKIFKAVKKHNLSHFVLKYENLVAEPEGSLRKLCEYLGIVYTPEMLNFQDLSKEMMKYAEQNVPADSYDKISAMHGNLSGEVNKKRVNAYQHELSAEQAAQLEYICSEYAKKFDYPVSKISVKAGWSLHKAYNWLKVRAYHAWLDLYYDLPLKMRLKWLKKK